MTTTTTATTPATSDSNARFSLRHLGVDEVNKRYNVISPPRRLVQRIPTIDGGDVKSKVQEMRNYVHNTMNIYEKLYDCIDCREGFYVAPIHKLRHPLIFYYGHTASFYINKLFVAGLTTRINPHFEEMFAVGVDEMSWDDLEEHHYDWPDVHDVCAYRLLIRERIDQMMQDPRYTPSLPLTFENSTQSEANKFWWVMMMGAEHERIHIETASVHVRELPLCYVRSSMSSFWSHCPQIVSPPPSNQLVEIASGEVRVGRLADSAIYGWDCDYSNGHVLATVPSFGASKHLVSNAEFFHFIKANGYETKRYWDEEGWQWAQWKQPRHPWFWVRDEQRPDGYALRLLVEEIDLPWSWPCELNHLEAKAFCRFKSEQLGMTIRLPSEEEWLLMYDRYVKKDQPYWGNDAVSANVALEQFRSSCPVDMFRHGDLYDVIGNVWQHCETTVYPYAGFNVHPFYDDFSVPTFDGRHTCMKGGAWISLGNESTRDARFAFRRHFFQFIGVRYIAGEPVSQPDFAKHGFGLDPEVDMITDTGFRRVFRGLPNGCQGIATYAREMFAAHARIPATRALDIACGGGRVSFELTAMFDEVVGVDYTARRLIPAFALRERGSCNYSVVPKQDGSERGAEGNARVSRTVDANRYPWGSTREKATFYQADPANLHLHLDHFALIVCWDCLHRCPRPDLVPPHLLSRLLPGGVLVIAHEASYTFPLSDAKVGPVQTNSGDVNKSNTTEMIFSLLGGATAVRRIEDASVSISVMFVHSDDAAEERVMHVHTFVKL